MEPHHNWKFLHKGYELQDGLNKSTMIPQFQSIMIYKITENMLVVRYYESDAIVISGKYIKQLYS